jgi:ribosomal protein S18 acetylase RimI-like enzyme
MPAVSPSHRVRWRPAAATDIEFLADVVIEATRDQGRWPADVDEAEFRAGYVNWTAGEVRTEVAGSTTYVIEVDEIPAGRLRVVRDSERIELAGIQLLPRHQSQGIGTHVIRGLMNEAAAGGVRFELNVEKDNPRARVLYERLGLAWESETTDENHMVWRPSAGTGLCP